MPRPSKGPRLKLQKASDRQRLWVIRDGQRTLGTGCPEGSRADAERKLAAYIAKKHDPKASRSGGDPNAIKIADALSAYLDERTKEGAKKPITDPKALIKRMLNLGLFFGERTIGELNGKLQRAYAEQRGSQSAARRELEDLAAAINHHTKEMLGGVQALFRPVLPDAPEARDRWLTRSEAARLIWAAWRKRSVYDGAEKGRHYTSRHIARFILVALSSGTRAGAICGASLMPTIGRGYINLETGEFRRLAYGKKETNKRQPTVTLPPPLLAHIRRWHRLGISKNAVVEYRGKPLTRVSTGWHAIVKRAGLATNIPQQKVIPHTLRHTAISWYLRAGNPPQKVADYCGVSIQIINKHYKHHLPGAFDDIAASSHKIGRVPETYQKATQ